MPRLYLHLGLHKTGTSSLQRYLADNRDALRDHGVLFPRIWIRNSAQHDLAEIVDSRALKSLVTKQLATFAEESAGMETVIISSETLALLPNPRSLIRYFPNHDVKVILYLRQHLAHSISWYQQSVHLSDTTVPASEFLAKNGLEFSPVVSRWRRAVGRQNILLGNYDRESMSGNDIVADFFDLIQRPELADLPRIGWDSNPSIGGNLFYFKRFLNLWITRSQCREYELLFTRLAHENNRFRGSLGMNRIATDIWNTVYEHDRHSLQREYGFDLGTPPDCVLGAHMPEMSTWENDKELIRTRIEEEAPEVRKAADRVVALC